MWARNEVDHRVSELLGRPATAGSIGEFVASRVFGVELARSGSQAGYDGVFTPGPLAGRRVNVKAYGRHEGILNISLPPCECYLVLTGPAGPGRKLPWVIDQVFPFDAELLLAALRERGVGCTFTRAGVSSHSSGSPRWSCSCFATSPSSISDISVSPLPLAVPVHVLRVGGPAGDRSPEPHVTQHHGSSTPSWLTTQKLTTASCTSQEAIGPMRL